ncbi:MAG: aspartate aminotransferase family protein [Gammaproteobacteria bacterium]|nr:aspartate aminotransferase family protein [Gammaproteobacteria bacterium]
MSNFVLSDDLGPNGRNVRESLTAKNAESQRLTSQTRELMNMGSAASVEMPFPVLMEKGEGAFLWDVDGNRYIDFQIGFGSLVLGHRHPEVQAAIDDQANNRGWQFGLHNPNQLRVAEQLVGADNCVERVIFCNSGSEATMYAIRAARAFTGKPKLAMFDGAYHGAHDYGIGVADPTSPRDAPVYRPMGAGVPQAVVDNQLMLPYRSRHAFDIVRQHKDELALVMIEPAQSSNPHLNDEVGEFLHELLAVCRECGVLLLTDEVITGFRFAFGGAQEYYGLKPDLATYGKIIGGGLPVGAVGGRADIMRVFSGLAEGDPRGIMSGGTFSGNPLTMAAGDAQVKHLSENRDTVYPRINGLGERLAESVNGFARSENMAVQMLNAGSMFQIYFQGEEIRSSRDLNPGRTQAETEFYLHLLDGGVLVPGTRRSFVSAVHSEDTVDQAADIVRNCLSLVRDDGLL